MTTTTAAPADHKKEIAAGARAFRTELKCWRLHRFEPSPLLDKEIIDILVAGFKEQAESFFDADKATSYKDIIRATPSLIVRQQLEDCALVKKTYPKASQKKSRDDAIYYLAGSMIYRACNLADKLDAKITRVPYTYFERTPGR